MNAPSADRPYARNTWGWDGLRFTRSPSVVLISDDLYPETRYAKKDEAALLPNGAGPYCTFAVSGLPTASGVYVFFVDGVPRYVGRAENLKGRLYQYGHISPRNCYVGGRATNIGLNKHVRAALALRAEVEVFYHATPDFVTVERRMIEGLQPSWNVQGVNTGSVNAGSGHGMDGE
ncbi:MAG: GIY-YIG nuclease family protein [Vulcanimicrobiaceae bacterium]